MGQIWPGSLTLPLLNLPLPPVTGSILVGQPAQGMQGLAGTPQGGFISQSIQCDNGVVHVIDGVVRRFAHLPPYSPHQC